MVGERPKCSKPLSPLTTSSKWKNDPPWVNSPPFCGSDLEPLLWWLKMLLYAHKYPIQYPQQLLHLKDKSQTSFLWFRDWIFSNFPIYLTLQVILERKSKLIIENSIWLSKVDLGVKLGHLVQKWASPWSNWITRPNFMTFWNITIKIHFIDDFIKKLKTKK